ncbi:MAG: VOC family protein [Fimbriimonadaceae bacterium]|nr:VOC family protein [Fimbriimonadaceae bacterium]
MLSTILESAEHRFSKVALSERRSVGIHLSMTAFRCLVTDVDDALKFYVDLLGFQLVERWGPPFAMIERDGVTVWISGPGTSAARPLADGAQPEPGGWNRLVIETDDLDALIAKLRGAGVALRSDPISGPGGTQVLVEDGVGNLVELFSSA